MMRPVCLAVALLLGLAGCVQFGASSEARVYFLSPKGQFSQLPATPVDWQLVVEEPIPAGGLDTARIAVHPQANEIGYYNQARWAARAPSMVQTLIIESFENSQRIVGIARPGSTLKPDYLLRVELREFQAEFDAGAAQPHVNVVLIAQLVDRHNRRIVGSQRFAARPGAQAAKLHSVVQTFDDALGSALKALVGWSLRCGNFAAEAHNRGVTCPA